ncbi:hypothetical protein U1Q18_052609 [Sarracenia purpurea var. burkii]
MAFALLDAGSKRNTILFFTSRLFPNLSSSFLFSSLCRRKAQSVSSPSQIQTPPSPKKIPFRVSANGMAWDDPYHWMCNTSDPDFIDYLHRENSYAETFMADTQNLQKTLFSEMSSRIPAKISTPPERWGPWCVHFLQNLR